MSDTEKKALNAGLVEALGATITFTCDSDAVLEFKTIWLEDVPEQGNRHDRRAQAALYKYHHSRRFKL